MISITATATIWFISIVDVNFYNIIIYKYYIFKNFLKISKRYLKAHRNYYFHTHN